MSAQLFRRLERGEFVDRYGAVFESVFVVGDELAIASPKWPQAPVAYGMNLDGDTFGAIRRAARQAGDEEWIATTVETIPRHVCSIVAGWTESALRAVHDSTLLGHFDGCLFGSSGRWGLLYLNAEDYGVFAAEPSIFSMFQDAGGGSSRVRDRFLNFMQTEWHGSEERRQAVLQRFGYV